MCNMFIQRGGHITVTFTRHRRYFWNLVQVRLEIPCNLKFHGEKDEIQKFKKLLQLKKKLNQLFLVISYTTFNCLTTRILLQFMFS